MKPQTLLLSALVLAACNAEPQKSPPTKIPDPRVSGGDALKPWQDYINQIAIDKSNPRWRLKLSRPPTFTFDDAKSYFWVLETTLGEIKIKLLPEVAPNHASSTIFLTLLGYYDGIVFHRIIPGFMAQGGCPLGTGTGGPGYEYGGEFDQNVRHTAGGLLSMANRGPGTDGSQFFITFGAATHLDDKHTIFGKVETGMKTVRALEKRGIPGNREGTPRERITIDKATIVVE